MGANAIKFTHEEIAAYYAARVQDLKQTDMREWRGPCPLHQGEHDNFAVDPPTGLWFCHSQCERGGDIITLEMELTGAHFRRAKTQVFRVIGRVEFSIRLRSRNLR